VVGDGNENRAVADRPRHTLDRRAGELATGLRSAARLLRRAYEPVADARLVEQVARPGGVGLDLPAQMRDIDVQVVRLLSIRRAPDRAQDRRMRQQLALVLREQ